MANSPNLLDALLRYAWATAPDGAQTFLERLQQLQREAFLRVSTGALISHSGSGRSTQWASGFSPDISPTDILDCCAEALDIYTKAVRDLGATEDETFFNQCLSYCGSATTFRPDFSCRAY